MLLLVVLVTYLRKGAQDVLVNLSIEDGKYTVVNTRRW